MNPLIKELHDRIGVSFDVIDSETGDMKHRL